ncbi:hypothetical protein CHS0354_031599 [Potamilus streckersoni]|uniref:Uncharacterized protein n=1 Tax=Potamilus streckersoni TaxID=2493646 RepID=A0AAE0SGW6_9BIVA|nr:hypothetical protein CHS0354_031599 [Potamilus streckersoni]
MMLPVKVYETVALLPVPNYEEKYSVSFLDFSSMKRFNDKVIFEPCLVPVKYRDTIVCYKDSTRKRYVSHTLYEPKVKPKHFLDTIVILPKRPIKTFLSCVDYHVDECRKWFKTSLEFRAKTYTTHKIQEKDETELNGVVWTDGLTNSDSDESCLHKNIENGPGASQVFLPRFNKGRNISDPVPTIHLNGMIHNGF